LPGQRQIWERHIFSRATGARLIRPQLACLFEPPTGDLAWSKRALTGGPVSARRMGEQRA